MSWYVWYLCIGMFIGACVNALVSLIICIDKEDKYDILKDFSHISFATMTITIFITLTLLWPLFILSHIVIGAFKIYFSFKKT